MNTRKPLMKIFKKLLKQHGSRKWWPAKTRFEVIVGAVLAQNVSWRNARKAVDNLKKHNLLSPKALLLAEHKEIADKIKTSRFYNQKAEKLKTFCAYLAEKHKCSLNKMFSTDAERLRQELLNLKGIGKETADSILLYAGKKLSFVSDAYTKRFLQRYGLLNGMTEYDEIRDFFMDSLPKDIYIYNEYHALIVHHCYETCKSKPNCVGCSIRVIDKNNRCHFALE